MGIVGKEYVDEMASVRASYSGVFRRLVLHAQQSLDMYEQHDIESGIRSLVTSVGEEEDDDEEESSSESLGMEYSDDLSSADCCVHQRKYATVPASRCSNRASAVSQHPPLSSSSTGSNERVFRDMRWLHRQGSGSVHSSSSTSNTFETMIMDMQRSRYQDDFVQLRTLGRGGFGRVFEARNKLDGRRYAVKQIKVRGQVTADKTLRETKTLAGLEHPNIVRYYSSWIEVSQQLRRQQPMPPPPRSFPPPLLDDLQAYDMCPAGEKEGRLVDSCSGSLSSSSSSSETSANPPLALMGLFAGGRRCSSSHSDGLDWSGDGLSTDAMRTAADPFDDISSDIVFESSTEAVANDAHIEFTEDCSSSSAAAAVTTTAETTTARSYPIPIKSSFHRRQRSLMESGSGRMHSSPLSASHAGSSDSVLVVGETTLYIQMQMCQTTLQQFIAERNRRIGGACEGTPPLIDPVLNVRLFRAIVEGVRYFHARGVIHRDLKGANVFVDIAYADSGGNPIS
ncbi:hypothetical protein IWW38_000621, partial [Coemansia aciculifera]